ncbi:metallophosphoesterase family protein [Agromyces humi]|uniref:metallophosphoesterase family protein n=1 Tax=Agromyces humi TaxID=1766800 RepID=UPI001357E757|nr:metallophosphoesterase [Agromyces humi]
MSSITFMHTGDEHIDSDAHGTINPVTGRNTAWESNYRVLRFLAEEAVERRAGFFLSAGDNFKTGRPSQEALLMFVEALTPLADAKIPVILLDGNHHLTGVPADHRTVIHVVAEMLRAKGGTVVIASDPQLIRLDNGAQIAALPWLSKNRVLNELELTDLSAAEGDRAVAEYGIRKLEELAGQADPNAPLIMASHVTVDHLRIDAVTEGFRRGSEMDLAHLFSEPVLPIAELNKLPFQYGALGHIHTPQHFGDRYWYAGSPNRITFTDMPDEKAGNFVTLDGGALDVERIGTPARRMVSIDLEAEDWEQVLDTVAEKDLVQVKLVTGAPEVPREIRKAIAAAGATLADTKARPKPRAETKKVALPEKVDPMTALKKWAELNAPAGIAPETLVDAAEALAA